VSDIHLKLSTGVHYPRGIRWNDSEDKRSDVKVTSLYNVFI